MMSLHTLLAFLALLGGVFGRPQNPEQGLYGQSSEQNRAVLDWYSPKQIRLTQNGKAVTVPPMFNGMSYHSPPNISAEAQRLFSQPLPDNPRYKAFRDADGWTRDQSLKADGTAPPPRYASLNLFGLQEDSDSFAETFISGAFPWTPTIAQCRCGYNNEPSGPVMKNTQTVGCSPKTFKNNINARPLLQAKFDLVIDTLANATAVEILRTMKDPAGKGYKVGDHIPVELDNGESLFIKAAGIDPSEEFTAHSWFIVKQYALYSELVRGDHDCPSPVVECGKFALDPCDAYPPKLKMRRMRREREGR